MKKTLVAAGVVMTLGASTAFADFAPTLFETSGTSETLGVSANAVISDAGNTLTITLTNTSDVTANGQVLTNFEFDIIDGVTYTLDSVSASGTASCTGTGASTTCTQDSPSKESGLDQWGILADFGGSTVLGAGFKNGNTFDYSPFGIVNTSILTDGHDGLSTKQPFLLGPVTFSITTNQTLTLADLTNIQFSFGTVPSLTPVTSTGGPFTSGQMPEPSSSALALLGVGMIGVTFMMRRRSKPS